MYYSMKKKNISLIIVLLLINSVVFSQNTKYPEMVLVKGGSFKMGSNNGYDDEKPIHSVTLSNYYIGKYEVTVAQYREFCSQTGRAFPSKPSTRWYVDHNKVRSWNWRDNQPIVNVSWYDAVEYCKWLSKKTGDVYSLPTEAQWEYAAKGGSKGHGYKYAGSNTLKLVAWYDENTYERGLRPVGQLKANELGIYDMSGNVFEWCSDYYGRYSSKRAKDPKGPVRGSYKVVRGGSWYYVDSFCRITQRDSPKPGLKKFVYGFRVAKKAD